MKEKVQSYPIYVPLSACLIILFILVFGMADPADAASRERTSLQDAFKKAAGTYHVPLSVLLSVSYNETRWDSHDDKPSMAGGYGVMHLTDMDAPADLFAKGTPLNANARAAAQSRAAHTLDQAAKLIGAAPEALKTDQDKNILGGAALLADYQKRSVASCPLIRRIGTLQLPNTVARTIMKPQLISPIKSIKPSIKEPLGRLTQQKK
ncbi:N-acetylmuramoyl-L-alanine amidase [Sporolactobacillus inulinus]|uniref:N-acetylmuramoyl-L-alanine amidase n=1 Tax=Sporolactobacillus inulinus TaxID=2078 RepID=A0A4Y1ZH35_9BACL|nr:hypothetical protein [Sporolactobacillus inulinus]GAY78251.1 N-acetylmuramoyl-L-alanine amidase [Sporolactobacillus inulinus]